MKQKSIKLNSLLKEKGVKSVSQSKNDSIKGGRRRYMPPVGRPRTPNPSLGANK